MKTTDHFKIWFSKDKETWLPLENQLRLIRHREKNPSHTIYLVGADRLLSENSIQKRKDFCSKFNIIYLDLDNDLPSIIENESAEIRKNDDFKLLQLANQQIDKFFDTDPGISQQGNLAAASDAVRWISVLLKRGIYSDLDTEIDFRQVPNEIDADFLIPCKTAWEGIVINNNFIAASETSELADRIRKKLINNAETITNQLVYSDPRRWVHLLYGPEPVRNVICDYYGLNEKLEDKSIQEFEALALEIVSKISTTPHNLFQNERTHGMGAGDVSWATDSQEQASKKLLDAARLIQRMWKRKQGIALSANDNPEPARSNELPVAEEVDTEVVVTPDQSPKPQPVDGNKLAIQRLKENINLAILGKRVVTNPKTELPVDNVKSYLSWTNKHVTGVRGLTRFSHWYHGDSGVKRARDLLVIANDPAATYEQIVTQLQQTFDNSSTRKHSLSRYLMAQFEGMTFDNLKQMNNDKFQDEKSGYRFS